MNTHAAVDQVDDELSLFDIFDFLLNNWLVIAGGTVIGVLFVAAYLAVVPPVYEATLQIEMARISSANRGAADREVRGSPVEEAHLLVERLRLPSTYTVDSTKACISQDTPFPSKSLTGQVQSKVIKDVGSVAEITVPGKSPDAAKACAAAIFEMIRQQQETLLRPYINEALENKTSLEARLKDNQEFLDKMDRTAVQSAVYLSKRDESLWLMNQIADLDRSLRQSFKTRLVSPIYATPYPVAPKKLSLLVLSIFAGALVGIFFAFIHRQISAWRGRRR